MSVPCTNRQCLSYVLAILLLASACNMPGSNKPKSTAPATGIPAAILTNSAATLQSQISATNAQAAVQATNQAGKPVATQPPGQAPIPTNTATIQSPHGTLASPPTKTPLPTPTKTPLPVATDTPLPTPTSLIWPFTPLPTITTIPSSIPVINSGIEFKIENVNIHWCSGNPWAIIKIYNQGTKSLESLYLEIKDLTTDALLFSPALSNLPFKTSDRTCIYDGLSRLDPGQKLYIGGPLGATTLRAHTIQAIIKLCTQEDLLGTCVDKTIDFMMP